MKGVRVVLLIAVALSVGSSTPSSAGDCGQTSFGLYSWVGLDGRDSRGNNCFGPSGFRCYKPEDLGNRFELANPSCDPSTTSCAVRLRVSLKFPGLRDMIDEDGLFGSPTPFIHWYPCHGTDCERDIVCGTAGFGGRINRDFTDTWVQRGVTCDNALTQDQPFSLRAVVCETGCISSTLVDGLVFGGPQLAAQIGCDLPPMTGCGEGESTAQACCFGPGGGSIGGDGAGPGFGAPGTKARVFYQAGGTGAIGLPGSTEWNLTLGPGWSHEFAERIVPNPASGQPPESRVMLLTKWGTFRQFSQLEAAGPDLRKYQSNAPSDEFRTLYFDDVIDSWELHELDGTVHFYAPSGKWLLSVDRFGNETEGTYDASGRLSLVTFPDGRSERFTYYPDTDPVSPGKLHQVTEVGVDLFAGSPAPPERTTTFTWDGDELTRIDLADGTSHAFSYDPAHPGHISLWKRLGVDDGINPRPERVEAGYAYDANGNVIKAWSGAETPDDPYDPDLEGPDDPFTIDLWQLAFDSPALPETVTVTDPLGDDTTFGLGYDTSGKPRLESVTGSCPFCSVGPDTSFTYNAHPLLPDSATDARGTVTTFTYTPFGQLASRTEASGLSEARTTTWEYHLDFPGLVTKIIQPSVLGGADERVTIVDYEDTDLDGIEDRRVRRQTGFEHGVAFDYETVSLLNGAGVPTEVDPEGFGTTDKTTFAYDPARGNLVLSSRTDPLVGTTTLEHDAFNQRTATVAPDSARSETEYDTEAGTILRRVRRVVERGPDDTVETDDLVTVSEYGAFGDLERVVLPELNTIDYAYDFAGRLVRIERRSTDGTEREAIAYTLDTAGNRTTEQRLRWDDAAQAWQTTSTTNFAFETRCHLREVIEDGATVAEYERDCNGNVTKIWDALHPRVTGDDWVTLNAYDALNRLTGVTSPWDGDGDGVTESQLSTSYGYNSQDHLISVTDAEGNATSYTYSDRDRLTHEVSPVSGTTEHHYRPDAHGTLQTTLDARGVTVTRTTDELDRVTEVNYSTDATLTTTYAYHDTPDACFGQGRLAGITRNGKTIEACWDRFGRQTQDGELTLAYDANGNRTQLVYPGGVTATFGFDFADREESVSVTSPGGTTQVASGGSYLPSGPLTSLTLGNTLLETRGFDSRYHPTVLALRSDPDPMVPEVRKWRYTMDDVGNVLEIESSSPALCPNPNLDLSNETVTTTTSYEACNAIHAGPAFEVAAPGGEVTFTAGQLVALKDGFSVTDGRFVAGTEPTLTTGYSLRTFEYQAPQYFLAGATGPWGSLDWTYDGIGDRLTETRNGATDTYNYPTNAGGGKVPKLTSVDLAGGGSRGYAYGDAGHVTQVTPGANQIDFGIDAEGRLGGLDRLSGTDVVDLDYDGRSFLCEAVQTTGDGAAVRPLYGSEGLLHALRTKPTTASAEHTVYYVYLAGRPLAQLEITSSGQETWTYLMVDHLGTPLAASDAAGNVTWEGSFEPFGQDWQAGTSEGASESGIELRFPGQWWSEVWEDASLGANLYYNVHRLLEIQTGRYSRPDPLGAIRPDRTGLFTTNPLYAYAAGSPTFFVDPLGLKVVVDNPETKGSYENLKECFPLFRSVAEHFENDTWTDYGPDRTWTISDPDYNPPSCDVGGRRSKTRTIWVPPDWSCEEKARCLFHEFYELWLIRVGGYEPSRMGAGPAHNRARAFEEKIPMKKCCPSCS